MDPLLNRHEMFASRKIALDTNLSFRMQTHGSIW